MESSVAIDNKNILYTFILNTDGYYIVKDILYEKSYRTVYNLYFVKTFVWIISVYVVYT